MEPIETIAWHEIIDHGELHDWRAAQLARLGFPGPLMKRLWIVPFGLVFAAMVWLAIATLPDIKRYMRMHEM